MAFKRRSGRKAFEKLDRQTRAITFYAEDGGSWPHFEPIVAELTGRMGRTICYLTSSSTDPILTRADPRIVAIDIGEGLGRSFLFQTMEAGVVVATVPRLGIKVLPRSRHAEALGMKYVYVFHSMVSTHMIYDADGFDHYDTILCVGPHMAPEIRSRERLAGLPAKELLDHGYGRLDTILAATASVPDRAPNDPACVLVAPSWGPHCLFETCGPDVIEVLLDAGFEVIARPHPMTQKHTPDAIAALRSRFGSHARFTLDEDIASKASLERADVMVSDWSGAALEFAFGLERPVLFLDVPRKVNNPEYEAIGIEPFEAAVRDRIGEVVAPDDLGSIPTRVASMVGAAHEVREQIVAARSETIFNIGSSGPVAAEIIAAKADAFLGSGGR